VFLSVLTVFTNIPNVFAGGMMSALNRKTFNIAVIGENKDGMINQVVKELYADGDSRFTKNDGYGDLDVTKYSGDYDCKDMTYDGAYADKYNLAFDILELSNDVINHPYDDTNVNIAKFMKEHPLTLFLFDSNMPEEEYKPLMLNYMRFVKRHNITGYIMYVPIFCDKLYLEKGEEEAIRILNIFANFVGKVEECVYKEFPAVKDQCISGIPAQKDHLPYKLLNMIIYQFYSMKYVKKKIINY